MFLKLLVSTVFFMNQVSFAQGLKPSDEAKFKLLPHLMNSTQNVGSLLEILQPQITDGELNFTREFLAKQGVSDTDILPKIVRNGNDLTIGDMKVTVVSDGGIKFNGTIFRIKKHESFDQLVQRVHSTLVGKKESTSSIFQLILPQAQAKEVTYKMTNASGTTVAIVGAALTAVLIGTAVFLSSPFVLGATLVTIASMGAMALGIAAFGSRKSPRLFCEGKQMTIQFSDGATKYDFSKDANQPSVEIKSTKGITTKRIEKLDAEASGALVTVYQQACESKKSHEINAALTRVQEGQIKKDPSAGHLKGKQ